jgi:hypothetical protein
MEATYNRFRGIRPGEARLVLKEDDNLYLNVVFPKMAMLPGIGADAKVVAVDVNENVTMYDNDDFVERFETGEGIIRTRYFLKRRRIYRRSTAGDCERGYWRSIGGGGRGGLGRSIIGQRGG